MATKAKFFPEESFSSWAAYRAALRSSGARFRQRAFTRAREEDELSKVVERSGNSMKKTLNWWDLLWMSIGAVVGAGIFVTTGREARDVAGPAIILSYVVAGISSMLSAFCYTEFAIEVPVAGGSFAYLRIELGDFIAFLTAGNIILEYLIGQGAVARAWTSNFAALIDKHPDKLRIHARSLPHDFNKLDPIAAFVTLLFGSVAIVSTRATATANWIASFLNTIIMLLIIAGGSAKGSLSNLTPFLPFETRGIFTAATVVYFAYLGFDAVATLAEETRDPPRDVPIGLLGSMSIITALYCAMAAVLVAMQPYYAIDPDAPFAFAFAAAGWKWAQYVVALAALKGMTTVLLVSSVSQARYVTHIARTHMIPPWFAAVNATTATPARATVALLAIAAVVGFFTSLDTLASLLSISTLIIFLLVAVALLVRRHVVHEGSGAAPTPPRRIALLASLLVASAASAGGATAYYQIGGTGWWAYALACGAWGVSTGCIRMFVPRVRSPKKWGVPLVPWLPCASIGMNIFLLGAIDRQSYVRFGVMTIIILIYYAFVGLHASYDAAAEIQVQDAVAPAKEEP